MQRCKNALIYASVRAAAALFLALPRNVTELLARGAGRIAHRFAKHERQVARSQLQQAFPEASPAVCERWTRQMFQHLALSIAELTHLDQWLASPDAIVFSADTRAVLDAALAEGRGVVLVAGHIGNWELMAQALVRAGYPLCTIAKPLYDPRLTRWIHAERVRHGLEVIWRGDARSARHMLEVFRQGRMLGLLIDQDTTRDTALVPFFGRPAATPTGAAALALRFKAPTVVIWAHRHTDTASGRVRHTITARRLPPLAAEAAHADRDKTTSAMTAQMNAALETAIRTHPSQWVWLHRRWRRQSIAP